MNEVLKLRLRQGAKVEDPAFDVTQDHYAVTYQGEDPVDNLRQALDWMIANPLDDVKKKFPGGNGPSNKLVVVSAQIYWQTPKLVLPSADALEGSDPFVNTGCHWLTYETVLNKPKFRKSNQEVKVGLYAACLSDMQLWFRDDIDDLPFKALCDSFLPDHTVDEVRLLSQASWWWKQQKDLDTLVGKKAPYFEALPDLKPPAVDHPGIFSDSADELVGSRAGLRLHLPRMIVMPYNFWDNTTESSALGTGPQFTAEAGGPRHPIPLIQVKTGIANPDSWSMWPTASRSSVMRLKNVKAAGIVWPVADWVAWPFDHAEKRRNDFKYAPARLPLFVNATFKAEVAGDTHFKYAKKDDYLFSVKTGVCVVGFDAQLKANKDIIGKDDEWLVGCMRSDTIMAIEKLATKGKPPKDILIQTEIMMALERLESPNLPKKGVDGVALRDISSLELDKHYIPPLSIPFIAMDMKTLTEEFALVDNPAWCALWQKAWAEALGRAKAFFLVQYGMQHANPNVQNYLIEFSAGALGPEPPVRIIIRDVADALLCREVAWALFGKDEPCPQDADAHAALGEMRLPVLRYNFRSAAQCHHNETGDIDVQFGPSGIQFLWHRFSNFYAAWKGDADKLNECPPTRLAKVLRLSSVWGIAHSAAYVRTIESALGVEFGTIRWDHLVDPDHDPERFVRDGKNYADYERISKVDLKWEEDAAAIIQVQFRDTLRGKICDYHNRAWKPATPTFQIRVQSPTGQALAHTVVYITETVNSATSMRFTDSEGKIPFFAKARTDFKFEIGRGAHTGGPGAWDRTKVALAFDAEADGVASYKAPAPKPPVVTVAAVVPPVVGTITLSATATADVAQSMATVQFQLDAGNLGLPLAALPYDLVFDSTTVPNGVHSITAIAQDADGRSTTAVAVSITVAN